MTPTKADIKLIKSLDRKRFRDIHGKFIIEGEKLIEEAMSAGIEIIKVFRREHLGEELMSRISLLSSPSPVLAIAKKPFEKPFEVPNQEELYLALDSIKDPGNIGTIIRMAEWFGVKAIYCSPDCVDVYNPKVVQSTMGSLFRVKVSYIELKELVIMAKKNIPVYGTFMDSGTEIMLIGDSDGNIYKLGGGEETIDYEMVIGPTTFGVNTKVKRIRRLYVVASLSTGASMNLAASNADSGSYGTAVSVTANTTINRIKKYLPLNLSTPGSAFCYRLKISGKGSVVIHEIGVDIGIRGV